MRFPDKKLVVIAKSRKHAFPVILLVTTGGFYGMVADVITQPVILQGILIGQENAIRPLVAVDRTVPAQVDTTRQFCIRSAAVPPRCAAEPTTR